MNLSLLVAQEKWQEFDDAWSELMQAGGSVDDLFTALRLAGEKKRLPRCLPRVREHADLLGTGGRPADAARLLGLVLTGGGAPGELLDPLYANAQKAWGSENWWDKYTELAGLQPGNPDARRAWVSFERLLGFGPGKLVYHSGGWGVGEVTEIRHELWELTVTFAGGRRDRFPLSAALEIFEPLPEDDLRAQHFRNPDAMRKRLREDPLVMLRAVVERHNGRASNMAIKNALMQVGIEGSSWTGWWRKARKLAEGSEWFRVTGTAAKGEVQILFAATDPVEDLKRQLAHALNLGDLLTRIRNQLTGNKADERMRAMMLDLLEKHATASPESATTRLAAWMFLRDQRGSASPVLLDILRTAAAEKASTDSARTPALWALFQSLPGVRDQEVCVECLRDVFGEAWLDEGVKSLQHAPPGMVRPLVDALITGGRKPDLAVHYRELLGRPLRTPDLLVTLARLAEAGKLPGEYPTPVLRAQALLSLATYLFVNRRGEPHHARTQTRLVEFLTKGREPVLRRLLADADVDALQSLSRLLQRGVDESIDAMFTEIAMHSVPTHARGAPPNFWEGDHIWSTRAGLQRRRAELHHLREVKIPANQEAIGRAAAQGDLSENAEWEMAIEDQRNLTSRASEIETELRRVELIENALLPEDMACPGMVVRYRDTKAGSEHEIAILGPWDTDQDDRVVSYRAPLAAGLLGKRPGDTALIVLPGGSLDVEILAVAPHEMD